MKWRQPQLPRLQPTSGEYGDWKSIIAVTCYHCCVYCGISEAAYGGIDNFHVEHYKPKSKFENLTNVISNLYLACPICNRFKGDDWPNEPVSDHCLPAYPDPIQVDYNSLFETHLATHTISGLHIASRYLVERLYLNRPQLIRERRLNEYIARLEAICDAAKALADRAMTQELPIEEIHKTIRLLAASNEALRNTIKALRATPYTLPEVRRVERD